MNYNNLIIENKLLIIEIGNSRLKVDNGKEVKYFEYIIENAIENKNKIIDFLNFELEELKPSKIYYSSVNPEIENLVFINYDVKNINNFLSLSELDFSEISGMGIDRKLGLIAAKEQKNGNILTIDCGTAQTYNLLIDNKCKGGFITPGLNTRINSLFQFTKIPKIENIISNIKKDNMKISGKNSEDAIILGVFNGLLAEIKHFINHFQSKFENLNIYITGGNSLYFYNLLKENDFSLILQENLVNDGIKVILSKIYDK